MQRVVVNLREDFGRWRRTDEEEQAQGSLEETGRRRLTPTFAFSAAPVFAPTSSRHSNVDVER